MSVDNVKVSSDLLSLGIWFVPCGLDLRTQARHVGSSSGCLHHPLVARHTIANADKEEVCRDWHMLAGDAVALRAVAAVAAASALSSVQEQKLYYPCSPRSRTEESKLACSRLCGWLIGLPKDSLDTI